MQSLSSVEMKGRDLKTLWRLGLEINERPFKRPLLDLSKLSFSSFRKKGMSFYIIFRPFVLGMDSESDVINIMLMSIYSCSKGKFEERKVALKKEGTALDQSCTAATAAQNAQLEQLAEWE
ncbi:hypothetical protein YC2023_046782 [Brassica napus]|uniref:Uncharacterized protein n=1 Tax=Brassica campestris TaxID=3711 RepID=M4DYM8_BRACM|nr:unnamed protein product [Brassica rapa]